MRIGIFGGTFDPVHYGHLILAEQSREQAGLDEVWFVPAYRPPHKDLPITPFERRVEMLHLALAGQTHYRVETLEAERVGPSYTADTLDILHERRPNDDFFLLVGSDSLEDLPGWYDPARIVARAGLVVMARPNHPVPSPAQVRALLPISKETEFRYLQVDVPLIDLSSRDIRRRVQQSRSIRFMLPRSVEVFIGEKKLYR